MDKNPGLTFSGGLVVKNSPTNAGEEVRSLGWEDPLEKEMATHSSILAWKIPWTEKPGGPQSMGSQRVGHNWAQCSFARAHTHRKEGPRGHYAKWNKLVTKGQTLYEFTHMRYLEQWRQKVEWWLPGTGEEKRRGELVFNGDRVSVLQEGREFWRLMVAMECTYGPWTHTLKNG